MTATLGAYQWSGGTVPEMVLTWKEEDPNETTEEFGERVKRAIKHRLNTWPPI